MSVKKYKFVSPGVFLSEIDNSQLPEAPTAQGPVVIGRSDRGPGMRPVQVESFAEFVNVFGGPSFSPTQTDAWRAGSMTAPMYAVYAAQAWLKNNSPLTFVRLLGDEHPLKESGGEAGWFTRTSNGAFNGLANDGGGAYGLFVMPSSSAWINDGSDGNMVQLTGALAAVWYCNEGYIALSGAMAGIVDEPGNAANFTSSAGVLIQSLSGKKAFTAEVYDGTGVATEKIVFSLERNSSNFIRDVFNTSPSKTWTRVSDSTETYFLGQTFERHYYESFAIDGVRQANTVGAYGVILPLKLSDGASEQGDFRKPSQAAETGWFFSQDLATVPATTLASPVANSFNAQGMQKLFKLVALDGGTWINKNLKVSITNIRQPSNNSTSFGTFSVQLRRLMDTDGAIQLVEQFDNCDLNPNSPNYIAKKIGDKYQVWDTTNNRYTEYGDYNNQSKFVRVVMNVDVTNQTTDERLLPFGVYGPPTLRNVKFASGSYLATTDNINNASDQNTSGQAWMPYSASATDFPGGTATWIDSADPMTFIAISGNFASGQLGFTGSLNMPRTYLRVSSSDGSLSSPKSAYFGVDTTQGAEGFSTYDTSTQDVLYAQPKGITDFTVNSTSPIGYSWVFTLDDVSRQGGTGTGGDITPAALYVTGSRQAGNSITAISGTWTSVLDEGFNAFTTVFQGGFDGLDIYEKEPFNNTDALSSTATETNSYAYYSVKKAIDSVADPEVVEYNIATMPGITNTKLNDALIQQCEDRADSLAIVDLSSVYVPAEDAGSSNSYAAIRYTPKQAITALKNRSLNSSYGCAYFPWVQIRDSQNDRVLWAPPSIAALGTFSSSERSTQLWFAPAGFNRGGLTEGSAGIPVVGVRDKLTSKQRDDLYDANINPIASFPSEGVVIFGQKTLQVTPSALDRINVRRLMIFVKKRISQIANGLLFDQNVQATWDRFTAQVNPFLEGIRSQFGLTDFKVVLDTTTTTPELIDRNIMYAKIFLKPARAIEYIAIDFNITNTGASFED
jgi:hypothetical protein